uniref:Helitron_like_N domain-containing protein n=1 Tax=Panagrellus redivivus TaxID=6233 RepID=A0A7E4V070_PANRE
MLRQTTIGRGSFDDTFMGICDDDDAIIVGILLNLAEICVAEETFFTVILIRNVTGIKKMVYDDLDVLQDSAKVRKQLTEACANFETKKENETWAAAIDKEMHSAGFHETVLFQCKQADMKPVKNDYFKLLKQWTGQWQRNIIRGSSKYMYDCHDVFGRPDPMVMGIHRCVFQQVIELPYDNKKLLFPRRKVHRGGNMKDLHLYTDQTCAPHFQWKPDAEISDEYIPHNHCSFKITLKSTVLTCCCYTNAKDCSYGTVIDEVLACPDTAFSFIYNSKTGISSPSNKYNNSFTLHSRHMFHRNCTFKTDILRIGRTDDFIVNTVTVRSNNSICDSKGFNGCWRRRRKCVTQVTPIRTYCCQFIGSKAVSRNVFPVQESWGRYLRRELKEKLIFTKNCTYIFSNEGTGMSEMPGHPCVFFIDPQERRFLNAGLNDNFLIDYDFVQKRMYTSSKKLKMMQFIGRPSYRHCHDYASDAPPWYRMTIVAVLCITEENDEHPCDHPAVRETYLDTVLEMSKPQFKCNHSIEGYNKIWDPICVEKLSYRTVENFTTELGAPSRSLFHNPLWQTAFLTPAQTYYCINDKKANTAYCVCLPRTGHGKHDACNTGLVVNNLYSTEVYAPYKEDRAESNQTCTLDAASLNERNQKCGNIEVPRSHVCMLLLTELKSDAKSISCVKELELTHREKRWRADDENWKLYLMCRDRKFENEGKCFVQDTQFGYYASEPMIVCCCPAGECNEFITDFRKNFTFESPEKFADN